MRSEILAEAIATLDAEIGKLQAARSALSNLNGTADRSKVRRHMSAEARARISKAMKLRWAKRLRRAA